MISFMAGRRSCVVALALIAVGLWTGRCARPAARLVHTVGCRRDPSRGCKARHGCRAGESRGADRRRRAGARRQRRRCRGRHRLCHGGDLSPRRQHRRRRFYGDPFALSTAKTSPSIIARPRRRRPPRRFSSAPDGKPDMAKSRDSALGIGIPGTVAGLALALEKYGSGKFTLAEIAEARDRAGARRLRRHRRQRRHAARLASGGWRAGRRRQKSFPVPTAARCARATR